MFFLVNCFSRKVRQLLATSAAFSTHFVSNEFCGLFLLWGGASTSSNGGRSGAGQDPEARPGEVPPPPHAGSPPLLANRHAGHHARHRPGSGLPPSSAVAPVPWCQSRVLLIETEAKAETTFGAWSFHQSAGTSKLESEETRSFLIVQDHHATRFHGFVRAAQTASDGESASGGLPPGNCDAL